MNAYSFIISISACFMYALTIPIASGKENPEAQRVIASIPSLPKKVQVHKFILNTDNQVDFSKSLKIIEPEISSIARRSKKKEAIIEAFDDGAKDIHQYFQDNGYGSFNEQDAEYAQYYNEYLKWKEATFNVIYAVSTSKKDGNIEIHALVTGYSTFRYINDPITIKSTFSKDKLHELSWEGSLGGSLVNIIKRMILSNDAENITSLPTIPSRFQKDDMERYLISNLVEEASADFDAYKIDDTDFQLIHTVLTPPNPKMSRIAERSRKKEIIMEAIEEGEADIGGYIRVNGGGKMNQSDIEFAKYHEMLLKYSIETFESAYIITKRKAKTVEVVGLLLGYYCNPQIAPLDCLHNTKKTLLAKELKYYSTGTEQKSMLTFLQDIIQKQSCLKVYP